MDEAHEVKFACDLFIINSLLFSFVLFWAFPCKIRKIVAVDERGILCFQDKIKYKPKKKEEEENKTGSSADFVNTILSTGNENAGKLLLGEAEKKPVPVEPAKIENKIDDEEEDDDIDWGALDDEPVQQEVQQEVKFETNSNFKGS